MDFLVSLRFQWDSLRLTWTRLDSLRLTWVRLDSLALTWTHLDLLGLTWTRLDSPGRTWSHLDSLGLTWIHLDPLGPTLGSVNLAREEKKDPKANKKRRGGDPEFDLIPTRHPDRARTRTGWHETISRLDPANLRWICSGRTIFLQMSDQATIQ